MTETLASTSSPMATSGGTPPPEAAWINAYQRLSPRWQSSALSPQSVIPIAISRVNQVDAGRLDIEMSAMLKEQMVKSVIPIAISRVNQVDAGRLDIEMSAMLKEQMVKVFSVMKPGLLFQYEAELDAFLEFLIWRFSIWVDKPTPGNALMNLRYRDERATDMRGKIRTGLEGPGLTVYQKILYCVATVGGQYIWTRLQSFSAFRQWGDSEQRTLARRAWLIVQRIEGLYKAASFTNLLVFLFTGRYRNLIERALRARLVYGSPHMNRAVSFEYMNRQLVWNEFSEMLLLLLPLLNSSTMKNFLSPFSKDKASGSSGDETLCPICQTNPTTVYLALPCQHRYCYYCLRTRCAATPSFRCSRCSEPVVAMQRHGGSVP
ncbi:putative transcription factor C2H2 family [Helianthus annuus]|nr:putative transcription factor C2H2 family [Helianthus annuus]